MNYIASLFFRPKIPVIFLRQNITQGVYHSISRQLNKLYNLKAIAVVIDSQKGQPVQTEMLAHKIKQLATKHKIPIYSFVQTRCTGEACTLVSIAYKSYCLPNSIIGLYRNINWFGFRELLEHKKINVRSWASFKNSILARLSFLQKGQKQDIIQRMQQIQETQARSSLQRFNKQDPQSNRQYLIGKEAIQKGFVSEIGNFYTILGKLYPNTKFKFIEHSTILREYLQLALAMPFIIICALLGAKAFVKYATLLAIYLFYKKKAHKHDGEAEKKHS